MHFTLGKVMSNYKNLSTKLVHTGRKKRNTQGAVNPVIQRASSLVFETLEEKTRYTKPLQRSIILWQTWHSHSFFITRSDV